MNKTLKRVLVFLIALAMLIGMLIGFSAVVFAEMRMILPRSMPAISAATVILTSIQAAGTVAAGTAITMAAVRFFSLGLLP